MIQGQLASRRQLAIEGISAELKRLFGSEIDLTYGLKGNAEHRQLFMLERIHGALKEETFIEVNQQEFDGEPAYTLTEILEIEGLSKTSIKALQAALNGSSE